MPSCIRPARRRRRAHRPAGRDRAARSATMARTAAMPSSRSAPRHRRAVEDRVGEALELAAVEVAVGAERPVPAGVGLAEDVDVARSCSTRGCRSSRRRCRSRRRSGSPRASPCGRRRSGRGGRRAPSAKVEVDEPAVGAEALGQPRLHRLDRRRRGSGRCRGGGCRGRACSSGGGRPWGSPAGLRAVGAGDDERLHRVGHRVAVGAVAVPGLERERWPISPSMKAFAASMPASKRFMWPTWSTLPERATPGGGSRPPRPRRRAASRRGRACRPRAPWRRPARGRRRRWRR